MNRYAKCALFLAALTTQAGAGAAQDATEQLRASFDAINGSIVRIRTVADLQYEQTDSSQSDEKAIRPYAIDGTGVVVGSTMVDGNLEYLILTNHHIADASNYVEQVGGYLRTNTSNTFAVPRVHEETYLMHGEAASFGPKDIELIELVRFVRGDMTLLRTVGARRRLKPFTGAIGYSRGQVTAGDRIITSGFPFGGDRITAVGTILETDHHHQLGMPHDDLVVSFEVMPGQSGSPIFRIEQDPATNKISFRLIGLVHAKDAHRSYVVSTELWDEVVDEFPVELRDRWVRQ